jgi:hypothetical protein
MAKKKIDWQKYPVRRCFWMNECRLCSQMIASGQQYYDGGYGRRAHCQCADEEFVDRTLGATEEKGKK